MAIDAILKIARNLNIPVKNIGFAGAKDKTAITEQVISIRAIPRKRVERLSFEDIELTYIGQGNKPISLGDLKANRFRITVRNLEKRFFIKRADRIPNLFGPQRFSKNNAEIGKFLVQKNFKKAVDLIDQEIVKEYMSENLGDFIGALRQLSLKLRKLYIHSYQSQIWNETVEEYMKEKPFKSELIPIVGFQTQLKHNKVCNIIRKLMNREGITQRDFIIPQIPEISSEGSDRELYIQPENFRVTKDQDELNKGKEKAILSFTLPKGSYATVIVEYLFSNSF